MIENKQNRHTRKIFIVLKLVLLAILTTSLFACQTSSDATPEVNSTEIESPTIPAAPVTPQPKDAVIFVSPEGSSSPLSNQLETIITAFATQNNLEYNRTASLNADDLTNQIRVVVSYETPSNIAELAASSPQTKFLVIGDTTIEPSKNIFILSKPYGVPEQIGFLAGYTAAIITDDWRVGVISISDTTSGQLIRESFLLGVRYFCGLCLQTYPPYQDYPLFVEVSSNSSQEEWRLAADQLRNSAVKTIFITPPLGNEAFYTYLSENGFTIINSSNKPALTNDIIATTFGINLQVEISTILNRLLTEESGRELFLSPEFIYTAPNWISPGKITDINLIRQKLVDGSLYPLLP